ncbi:phage virion morphogenesis protein [Bacillus paralicheniformis]|uniref:phage virion morphogenesis protein n=1 Tax=Bacillus paralicheniformis TaxID=1648923 RepID=UPI001C96334B|nr:phage virion morphogenesis protein [Bacillus paralicheniformis]
MNIVINMQNTQATLRKLTNLKYNEPLKNSGTYLEGSIGKRFRSGGGSQPWPALSPTTKRIHPRRAGGKPLNDTGQLKMSVTAKARKNISRNRLRYGWGSGVKYAAFQNFGGVTGWGTRVPARPFLYVDTDDEKEIEKVFKEYIERQVR